MMVLSLFRDLLSMASKLFSGKTSHDRMSAPRGSPKISKGDGVPRLPLDCGDADSLAESCSMSGSLSGPCPPCGHCWVDCPTLSLPIHLVSFPVFLLQRKISPADEGLMLFCMTAEDQLLPLPVKPLRPP